MYVLYSLRVVKGVVHGYNIIFVMFNRYIQAQEMDNGDDFASVYILDYYLDERYALVVPIL